MDEATRIHLLTLKEIHLGNVRYLEVQEAQSAGDESIRLMNALTRERQRLEAVEAQLLANDGASDVDLTRLTHDRGYMAGVILQRIADVEERTNGALRVEHDERVDTLDREHVARASARAKDWRRWQWVYVWLGLLTLLLLLLLVRGGG